LLLLGRPQVESGRHLLLLLLLLLLRRRRRLLLLLLLRRRRRLLLLLRVAGGHDEIGIVRIVSSSSAGGISKDGDAVQRGERGLLLVFQLRLLGTGGVKGFFGERGGIGGRG